MNYAELSVAQHQRAKEFSKAQTDAMVAYCNAEHDLMELQAENDKLRERVHELEIEYDGATTAVLEKTERIEWLAGRLRGETNENAKLRELVVDMWPHVRHRSRMCSECELPCDTSDECLLYEPMRKRMAELGMEVEE